MIVIATQTFAPATGGMEAYLTSLADELAHAGHKTTVFADGKDGAFAPQSPYALQRFSGWRPLRRWKKRRALAALALQEKIDGIFCDSWKSVAAIPKGLSAPIVVLAHGAEYPPSPSKTKQNRIKKALRRCAAILANSHFTAQEVRRFLPDPNDPRLEVVHPPLLPLPSPTPEALDRLIALIGQRRPVISALARLEPRKGIDRVIAALPAILRRHPDAVFAIAGSGADAARLRSLAAEKDVADHVVFLGRIDADMKSALLSTSDVFAMPVRRVGTSVEGFGISYIEAAWFGVPSLGGKDSGAEDAVWDEKTGLLCDGENGAEVEKKLLRLLDDAPFAKKLGEAARARVERDLLWSQSLRRFLAPFGL